MSKVTKKKAADSSGPLDVYLSQLPTSRLTAEEEQILARRIQSRSRGWQRARQRLVAGNLLLVVHVARRYARYAPLEDLVQEGNCGLIRAAELFDGLRGLRFSTYAMWWIRQTIMRYLSNYSRMIRLPVGVHLELLALNRNREKLEASLGRMPTEDELASVTHMKPNRVDRILATDITKMPLSLDDPEGYNNSSNHGHNGRRCLGDIVPDLRAVSPEDHLKESEQEQQAKSLSRELLAGLSARESVVIRNRFGFDGEPQTLQQIGQSLGLSRERIRQIQNKAMAKLKAQCTLQ